MNMIIIRTNEEINSVLAACNENIESGSKYSGMSYEEGIKAMYDWLIGNTDEYPI